MEFFDTKQATQQETSDSTVVVELDLTALCLVGGGGGEVIFG